MTTDVPTKWCPECGNDYKSHLERCPFCVSIYFPSQAEIRAMCEVIQQGWSKAERNSRSCFPELHPEIEICKVVKSRTVWKPE